MKMTRDQVIAGALLLVAVAACSYALGKYVGVRQQSWRAAVAAHHTAVDHCMTLGKEVTKRLNLAWRARMSLADFEEHFGKAVPVDQGTFPEAGDRDTHVFTHVPSHRVFYLRFENGVLTELGGTHGPDDIQPHLPSIEERMAKMK